MNLLLLFILLCSTTASRPSAATAPVIKAGYYYPWWKPGIPEISSIRFSYFTHILYAFVHADPLTHELNIPPADAALITILTATAHSQNPPVKALLSIGGESFNNTAFSAMAADPSSRAVFINSTIAITRRFDLDGLDLDWEFPDTSNQMSDLGDLLIQWRQAIEAESALCHRPPLLLTAAVNYASRTPHAAYPVAAMASSLDWINPMCYEYHYAERDPSITGEHAALYDARSNRSTSFGLGSWVESGMPKEKVVMGIPLYGRSWTLRDPAEHGIGAAAAGPGPGLPGGYTPYVDVVEFNSRNATAIYDETMVAAYSYEGTAWVGYDDPRSVEAKVSFGRKMGIRGYFFWALGHDDKNWTLSRTASRAWGNKSSTGQQK